MRHQSILTGMLIGLLLPAIGPVASAADAVRHELKAESKVTVEVLPDGNVRMWAHNARLVPYTLFNTQSDHPTVFPRLATVITDDLIQKAHPRD